MGADVALAWSQARSEPSATASAAIVLTRRNECMICLLVFRQVQLFTRALAVPQPRVPRAHIRKYGSSTWASVIRFTGNPLRTATRRIASGVVASEAQKVLLLSFVT